MGAILTNLGKHNLPITWLGGEAGAFPIPGSTLFSPKMPLPVSKMLSCYALPVPAGLLWDAMPAGQRRSLGWFQLMSS